MESVWVGVSSLFQSKFGKKGEDLEALILAGERVFALWKDPDDGGGWRWPGPICDRVLFPPTVVKSDYEKHAKHYNFEALIVRRSTVGEPPNGPVVALVAG